jgi:hypothetical protein
LQTWIIEDYSEPIPVELPDIGLDVVPNCIEPRLTKSNYEIYYAPQDESIRCFTPSQGLIDLV